MSQLGDFLKQLRERSNLTQRAAAKLCGIGPSTLTRSEEIDSSRPIKLETLKDISKVYQASEQEWLELLSFWLKHEAGIDQSKLIIQPLSSDLLMDDRASLIAQIQNLASNLSSEDKAILLEILQTPQLFHVSREIVQLARFFKK